MLGNRGFPEAWSRLCVCQASFLMTFAMGGVPHAGSRQSPSPRIHSNSCPSSRWCHPAISSSVIPFSSCLQSLPASESSNESTLHLRWPKYWSFSFSISPSKEQPGLISFRKDWLDLLASPRDSQEPSPTPQFKSINSSVLSFLHSPTLRSIHDHWKNIALTRRTLVSKVMSLLFNMLSRLEITSFQGVSIF